MGGIHQLAEAGDITGLQRRHALQGPLVFGDDKPMRRNSPCSPELFSAHTTQCDFERERDQLITAIDSFVTNGAAFPCSRAADDTFVGSCYRKNSSLLIGFDE